MPRGSPKTSATGPLTTAIPRDSLSACCRPLHQSRPAHASPVGIRRPPASKQGSLLTLRPRGRRFGQAKTCFLLVFPLFPRVFSRQNRRRRCPSSRLSQVPQRTNHPVRPAARASRAHHGGSRDVVGCGGTRAEAGAGGPRKSGLRPGGRRDVQRGAGHRGVEPTPAGAQGQGGGRDHSSGPSRRRGIGRRAWILRAMRARVTRLRGVARGKRLRQRGAA